MTVQPDLQFRRLEEGELPLAEELVESIRAQNIPDGEAFGHENGILGFSGHVPWGVFIRGELAGAAWLAQEFPDRRAEIISVVMARGWWKMGLTGWVLEGLGKAARLAGASSTVVHLKNGGPALGEVLDDAGFSGPDPEDEKYPVGTWENRGRGVNFG